MSKFGYSYPPGVSEKDLPGNSPEEQEHEAMIESLYEAIAPLRSGHTDDGEDQVVLALEKIVSAAYLKGYENGRGDEAMAQEAKQDSLKPDASRPYRNLQVEPGDLGND